MDAGSGYSAHYGNHGDFDDCFGLVGVISGRINNCIGNCFSGNCPRACHGKELGNDVAQ